MQAFTHISSPAFTFLPSLHAPTLLRASTPIIPLPGPLLSFAAPFSRPIISSLSPIALPPPRETRSVPLSRFLYYTPWTVARQPPFLPSISGAVVRSNGDDLARRRGTQSTARSTRAGLGSSSVAPLVRSEYCRLLHHLVARSLASPEA